MEANQQPVQSQGMAYQSPAPVAPVVSVKEWMLAMLIMCIPIVNIIMMFVWAFGNGNPSKQNYFKAALLWTAIVIVLYIIIGVVIVGAITASMN